MLDWAADRYLGADDFSRQHQERFGRQHQERHSNGLTGRHRAPYFAASENLDLGGTVALFTHDAVIMANDFNTVAGTAQIRAIYEGAYARMRIEGGNYEVDGIRESDDLAVVRARSGGRVRPVGDDDDRGPPGVVRTPPLELRLANHGSHVQLARSHQLVAPDCDTPPL